MELARLVERRSPSPSLVKLLESIGLLLEIPPVKTHTWYKVPLPSNYEATLRLVVTDFSSVLQRLLTIRSSEISMPTAEAFFSKLQEPGFDYEEAVNGGGLGIRELFNAVLIILMRLRSDTQRAPLDARNCVCLVDGSRPSYLAFDTAAHMLRHGTLHILTYPQYYVSAANVASDMATLVTAAPKAGVVVEELLARSIERQAVEQFKLPTHRIAVHRGAQLKLPPVQTNPGEVSTHSLTLSEDGQEGGYDFDSNPSAELLRRVEMLVEAGNISVLAVGLSDAHCFGDVHGVETLGRYALRRFPGDVIITKNASYSRAFHSAADSRTFLLSISPYIDPSIPFLHALHFCRPEDRLVVVTIFPGRTPQGDIRETRFDFGRRHNWVADTPTTMAEMSYWTSAEANEANDLYAIPDETEDETSNASQNGSHFEDTIKDTVSQSRALSASSRPSTSGDQGVELDELPSENSHHSEKSGSMTQLKSDQMTEDEAMAAIAVDLSELTANPHHMGWNDQFVDAYAAKVRALIRQSGLSSGDFMIRYTETESPVILTNGAELVSVAAQVSATAVFVHLSSEPDLVVELVREAPTTVVILK